MNQKITIPIVIAISVIVTAGIMFSVGNDNQPQITQTPQTEIVYVEKTVSEFFEGTNNVKKISSQDELKGILDASSSLGGNFYDDRMVRSFAVAESASFDSAQTTGAPDPMLHLCLLMEQLKQYRRIRIFNNKCSSTKCR